MTTIPGQFFSSVEIHNSKGKTGLSNPSYRGLALQLLTLFSLAFLPGYFGFFDGIPLALGWIILSVISTFPLAFNMLRSLLYSNSSATINKPSSVIELQKYGYKGFLVGENFMKTNDPGKSANKFIKKIENEN